MIQKVTATFTSNCHPVQLEDIIPTFCTRNSACDFTVKFG